MKVLVQERGSMRGCDQLYIIADNGDATYMRVEEDGETVYVRALHRNERREIREWFTKGVRARSTLVLEV